MPAAASGVLGALLACQRNPADPQAWEGLLGLIYPALLGIASRILRQWGVTGTDDRLDLAQEMCMRLSRSIANVPGGALASEESAAAYLKALAANAARDSLRLRFARKRGMRSTVALEDRLPELVERLDFHPTERAALVSQVDSLLEGAEREKAVFWLYFRQGFSAREISSIPSVSLSIKGVESLLHRMAKQVRERIAAGSRPATEVTE